MYKLIQKYMMVNEIREHSQSWYYALFKHLFKEFPNIQANSHNVVGKGEKQDTKLSVWYTWLDLTFYSHSTHLLSNYNVLC